MKKFFPYLIFSVMFILSFIPFVIAQDANVTPVIVPGVALLDKILLYVQSSSALIGIVVTILVALAKAVSNERAPAVIAALQKILDIIPALLLKFAQVVSAVCEVLANALRSDGLLGKK